MSKARYYSRLAAVALSTAITIISVAPPSVEVWAASDINIGTAEELITFARESRDDVYTKGKTINITADIDLSGTDFSPIAIIAGNLEGNGHTISGVRFNSAASEAGFIRTVAESGVISNLKLEGDIEPSGSAENIGGIAGVNYGLITDCSYYGELDAEEAVGGIVGHNCEKGKIVNCINSASINGTRRTGGIVGFNEGIVENCSNSGFINNIPSDVKKKDSISDDEEEESNIEKLDPDSFDLLKGDLKELIADTGKVNYTGGIAGASAGIVGKCQNTGVVGYPHIGYKTGGIVGYDRGILYSCENKGIVNGRKNVGGIVGQFEPYVENIYKDDSFDKVSDELNTMIDNVSELNDTFGSSDDATQARIDAIRGTMDELRGTVSGYKSYYRAKDDVTTSEIRGYVDRLRGEIDDLELKKIPVKAGGLDNIKKDLKEIEELIGKAKQAASLGVAVDMSAFLAKLKSLNNDISDEVYTIKNAAQAANKNIGKMADDMDDVRTASASLDDYLRGAYDSYKNDFRATDDDITSETDTIASQMDALSDTLKSSDKAIRSQFDRLVNNMQDINKDLHNGFDELDDELSRIQNTKEIEDIFDDISDTKNADPGKGVITDCENSGAVNADINGGGIAGFAGVDIDIQSDFEVVSAGQVSLKYDRTKKATIINSRNNGVVRVRNDYAGGIAGRMDLGAVESCENYGQITSTDGDYIGGIAGFADYVIRGCYSLANVSGNDYVGGIVGKGKYLYNNTSMTRLLGSGEKYGAVAGTVDEEESSCSANTYVDYGIGAIDGVTMTDNAEAVTYSQLITREGTPENFKTMKVTFIADGTIVAVIKKPYGGSISKEELPKLDGIGGKYGHWEDIDLSNIVSNMTVNAEYEKLRTTIASDEPFPVMLVSGNFYGNAHLTYVRQEAGADNAPAGYKNVDKYVFDVENNVETDGQSYTVRVLADDYKDYYEAAVLKGDKLVPVSTSRDGRYMVFDMEDVGTFYIIKDKNHYLPYIIAGICAGVLIIIAVILKLIKKK